MGVFLSWLETSSAVHRSSRSRHHLRGRQAAARCAGALREWPSWWRTLLELIVRELCLRVVVLGAIGSIICTVSPRRRRKSWRPITPLSGSTIRNRDPSKTGTPSCTRGADAERRDSRAASPLSSPPLTDAPSGQACVVRFFRAEHHRVQQSLSCGEHSGALGGGAVFVTSAHHLTDGIRLNSTITVVHIGCDHQRKVGAGKSVLVKPVTTC
jgi:hypothetical protein